MNRCTSIELVSVDELIPHPKNCHSHPDEQINRLCKIIEYQGFRTPLTVQKGTNLIVCGHGRLIAAKKLGHSKVPVIYQEFESEEQLYAHLVADNAIGKDTWATLDLSSINAELENLGPDLDIDMLGLKDFEIEPAEKFEGQCDENHVPEVEHPITRRGDIWLLGNHRVMCGDSTMIDDVEKLMNGELAGMIHTDPPYNIAYEGGSKKREKIANDKLDNFNEFLAEAYANYFAFAHPGAAIYVWHAPTETHNFITEFIRAGFLYKSYIVWNKSKITFGRSDYHWKHESAIYGWKAGGSHSWFGDRKQTTVWDIDRPSSSDDHPTMKPIELCERAIINSSGPGMVVSDLFLGSGSTLIACEKTNRKCFGMELDEKYCDVIINRWEQFTGKEATLEATGQTYKQLKGERDGQT